MILYRLTERTEYNTFLSQVLLKRCLDRNTVHNGIDSHSAQYLLFFQRNSQLIEGFQQFWINFFHTFRSVFLNGSRVINNILIIDRRNFQQSPVRHFQCLPVTESTQAKLKQPFRLMFLGRNNPNGLFIQPSMDHICIYIRNESIFIFPIRYFIQHTI